MATLLESVKIACRVASDIYDDELSNLISAGFADLGITDINPALLTATDTLPLVKQAVITYCKMNFGKLEDSVYDRFKRSYDEQKSQLLMSSEYNTRG